MSDLVGDVKGQLEDMVDLMSSLEQVQIPSTLIAAVEEGWKLTVEAVEIKKTLEYDQEQRKHDKGRVVNARVVGEVLSEMERQTVNQLVVKPTQLFTNLVYGIAQFALDILIGLPVAIADAWKSKDLLQALAPYLKKFIKKFFDIISAKEMAHVLEDGIQIRDEMSQRLRDSALKQSSGPRYRRRKVTRT